MKTISIRQLHEKTGEWVRQAQAHEQIVITDRGKPVAALAPFRGAANHNRFENRKLLPEFKKYLGKLAGGSDSADLISEMRERE